MCRGIITKEIKEWAYLHESSPLEWIDEEDDDKIEDDEVNN